MTLGEGTAWALGLFDRFRLCARGRAEEVA